MAEPTGLVDGKVARVAVADGEVVVADVAAITAEADSQIPYRLTLTQRLALKDILKRKSEHEAGLAEANRDLQTFLMEKGLDPKAAYTIMPNEMAIVAAPTRRS